MRTQAGTAAAAFFVVSPAAAGSAGGGELSRGSRKEIPTGLASDYGERRVAAGAGKDSVVVPDASEGGRTWAFLMTIADSPGVPRPIGAGTDRNGIVTPTGDPT
jgi:hypothetical protein